MVHSGQDREGLRRIRSLELLTAAIILVIMVFVMFMVFSYRPS